MDASPAPLPPGRAELRLHVQGMDCADEASLIRHVLDVPGVLSLEFDLVGRRVDVSFDPTRIAAEHIIALVGRTGLGVHSHAPGEHVHADHDAHGSADAHRWRLRAWAASSAALLLAGWLIEAWHADSWTEALVGHAGVEGDGHPVGAMLAYGSSILLGLWPVLPRALASVRLVRLDMHVLVCVSAVGAAAVGQWAEGAAVACLFALAHLMEAWAIDRARQAVGDLVGHEPGWDDGGAVNAARVERWIERFAAVYTPIVTASALTLVLVPPLFDGAWGTWFYRGLIFLVLACPCALVISTPVTVVAALTSAARRGVLFRGGLALERAAADPDGALARGDVVLMPGALEDGRRFAGAHARRALGVIRENVTLALLTKLAFLVSAALGASPLWLAVLADTGATVAVTLNGLRLLRARRTA
ncbi:MAG: cation transporter [Vicinamibacterales bacterium]